MADFSFDDAAADAGMLGEDDLRARLTRAEEVLREIADQVANRVDHERTQGSENCPHCIVLNATRAYFDEEYGDG